MLGAAVRQVRSQEKGLAVIGFLSSNAPGTYAPAVAAFRQGLAETGYVEGQNVAIEYRWAEGHHDRLPALAAELVGRKVEVIAAGSLTATRAAKTATSTGFEDAPDLGNAAADISHRAVKDDVPR
jgi:putative tryptophan/tyrosine transport system substrate-binding protein